MVDKMDSKTASLCGSEDQEGFCLEPLLLLFSWWWWKGTLFINSFVDWTWLSCLSNGNTEDQFVIISWFFFWVFGLSAQLSAAWHLGGFLIRADFRASKFLRPRTSWKPWKNGFNADIVMLVWKVLLLLESHFKHWYWALPVVHYSCSSS